MRAQALSHLVKHYATLSGSQRHSTMVLVIAPVHDLESKNNFSIEVLWQPVTEA